MLRKTKIADGGRKDKGTGKGKNVAGAKPKVYGNSNYNPKTIGKAAVRYEVADIGPHLGQGYKYSTKAVKTGRGR
jgi:hypothetical protein